MTNLTYLDAGVDIEKGDSLVEKIKPLAMSTRRDGVLAGIGGFGALFEISKRYRDPVLVSGTDGVGTKLKLAFMLNRHDTVGIDLVAMSVNDILVQGAEPLFFLDYFACGKLDLTIAEQVISGIAEGCRQSDCALIGGETAEMPDMYPAGEYDLAGFAVGAVEKSAIIDGKSIQVGDVIIGLGSSGIHSNGFSLVRKVLSLQPEALEEQVSDLAGQMIPVSEALMRPTRIYVKAVRQLLKSIKIKGMAHITGGGIVGNLPRILCPELSAEIDSSSWPRAEIFEYLQKLGNVSDSEMYRVFNCGIGFTLVVAAKDASGALEILRANGENAQIIGKIVKSSGLAEVVIN